MALGVFGATVATSLSNPLRLLRSNPQYSTASDGDVEGPSTLIDPPPQIPGTGASRSSVLLPSNMSIAAAAPSISEPRTSVATLDRSVNGNERAIDVSILDSDEASLEVASDLPSVSEPASTLSGGQHTVLEIETTATQTKETETEQEPSHFKNYRQYINSLHSAFPDLASVLCIR